MSGLAQAVAAGSPAAEPLRCPGCGTALIARCNLGRTVRHHAWHPSWPQCRFGSATWGYFVTATELREALARGEGMHLASAESYALVARQIDHTVLSRNEGVTGLKREVVRMLKRLEEMEG